MTSRLLIALSVAGLCGIGTSAEARIVCRDGFQATRDGGWISTPYCNDEHLAEIGRRHGVKVSGAQIRANPARKYELCRLVGNSPPAMDYCPTQGSRGRGR